MEKIVEVTDKGFKIIKMSAIENMNILGGLGICDRCNQGSLDGILIPVLNMWMCPKCFDEWHEDARYYEEDKTFEDRVANKYENMIKKYNNNER